MCRIGSEAIFLGVILSALGTYISIVPNSCWEIRATIQAPLQGPPRKDKQTTKGPQEIANTIPDLCLFLCHNRGSLYQILQWYF